MSISNSANSNRIAKNTFVLYVRMLFLMALGLYTSRVILQTLGVEDFGIYNVVGGVVSLFSVLSGSLSAAISRYITFELGKSNYDRLNKIFCVSINIQLILGILIIVIVEIIGVWFMNNVMDIQSARLGAANWVLQISLFTFIINLINVPYNALIVAHERMSAFAYISILEGMGRLLIALLIGSAPFDRLIFYAFLMCLLSICIRLIYQVYCRRKFKESKYKIVHDNNLLKEIFGFAGWNFLGSSSGLLANHGLNLLMNVFFGVVANASRGVANQVDHVAHNFVSSFMTALNPQITKAYARGDYEYMHGLMCKGAKYSYFIMMIIVLPIMIETDLVLNLWLTVVPDFSVIFLRWTLIISLTYVLSNTLITAMLATGKIKKYQIIISSISYSILPLTYIFFHYGFSPYYGYIVVFLAYLIELFVRIKLLNQMVGLSMRRFCVEVILNVFIVTILSSIIPFLLYHLLLPGIFRFSLVVISCIISSFFSIWFFGLTDEEHELIKMKSVQYTKKIFSK